MALSLCKGPSIQAEEGKDLFEMRIRPLLAAQCYSCHSNRAMGGLRVDSRSGLLSGGISGPAIVPGDPESSLLIRAVQHVDRKLQMPFGGAKLADQEIENLEEWIRKGAPWPESSDLTVASHSRLDSAALDYWAFRPLSSPDVPTVENPQWARSPIDFLILARLEAKGLMVNRPASRRALIRRATFDLIGLPPTPEEVDSFLRDPSEEAFSKVIDRLLASPHYGERWGRFWLDVARYAEDDVRGLKQESYPNAFRYRDWVVQAFNTDMPYDLFVKAQIAADLLPLENRESLLPALGFFGLGPWYYDITVPRQARADERHDRVDALSRGFLGLTVACARCHDHKFDPISMRDYYGLAGIFASSQYVEYALAREEVVEAFHEKEKEIEQLRKKIDTFVETRSRELGEILATKTVDYLRAAREVFRQDGDAGGQASQMKEPGTGRDPGMEVTKPVVVPGETARLVAAREGLDAEVLQRWVAYLNNPQRDHSYLEGWDALWGRDEASESDVLAAAQTFQTTLLSIIEEKAALDARNRRILDRATPLEGARKTSLPNGFSTYDEFCPGCNVAVESIARDKLVLWSDLLNENRQRKDGSWNRGGVLHFDALTLERFVGEEWRDHLRSQRARLESLEKSLPERYPYLHGLGESEHAVDLQLNLRGSPFNLGERVPRGFLAVLGDSDPEPYQQGSGRLAMANAIATHGLTARVIANRIWAHHFGRGLVGTPSNFGRMGDAPTHPLLLEYLAHRLVTNGWSIKSLHREIMLSSTYRLSSDQDPDSSVIDSDNELYWRANRRRLDVEALRDALLFVAGNLDPSIGGPSLELNVENKRRTLYGRVSRFKLDPLLALFDFPTPAASSDQRNVTHVPLQKLFFLNSPFIRRQRAALAHRLNEEAGGKEAAMIDRAYRLLFGRPAEEQEVFLAKDFLGSASGQAEIAPWEQYVQVLLSSNEFLFLD